MMTPLDPETVAIIRAHYAGLELTWVDDDVACAVTVAEFCDSHEALRARGARRQEDCWRGLERERERQVALDAMMLPLGATARRALVAQTRDAQVSLKKQEEKP